MDVITFLHELKRAAIEATGDGSAIVRVEADQKISVGAARLVVIVSDRYFPWTMDANDLLAPNDTIEDCVEHMKAELAGQEPSEKEGY